jgi:hypothetical protein
MGEIFQMMQNAVEKNFRMVLNQEKNDIREIFQIEGE